MNTTQTRLTGRSGASLYLHHREGRVHIITPNTSTFSGDGRRGRASSADGECKRQERRKALSIRVKEGGKEKRVALYIVSGTFLLHGVFTVGVYTI